MEHRGQKNRGDIEDQVAFIHSKLYLAIFYKKKHVTHCLCYTSYILGLHAVAIQIDVAYRVAKTLVLSPLLTQLIECTCFLHYK